MDAPAVAVSHDGKTTAAAWMDMRSGTNNRDVQWTLGTAGKFAPEVTANDDKTGLQGHAALAVAKDGTVWCAWEDAREGPNAQRIYVADSKTRKNVALSTPAEGRCGFPSLASGGGWLGVAYEAGGAVHVRRVLTN
jgi:hypothetical protein